MFRSRLAAPADRVWAVCTTFAGINAELRPWLRMTHPRNVDALALADARPGTYLFRSYLLFLGVLPVDVDDITVAQVGPGRRFEERSRMLSASSWWHEREVVEVGDSTCDVVDRVSFEPRWTFLGVVLRAVVPRLFAHRHRQLRRRFSGAAAGTVLLTRG